ncbi:hypothetical protein FPANT_238 [Fusarium pseudoanthophilum]|uniref:Uncharacterized protein n=1 Tax=Fusarium pseudoanthophilum TaxID=48495 RepID=A0A8H5Q845_9HYPO|nr:hypothetical protein FPANT_238 [Fusarium pseudoanthophilum]
MAVIINAYGGVVLIAAFENSLIPHNGLLSTLDCTDLDANLQIGAVSWPFMSDMAYLPRPAAVPFAAPTPLSTPTSKRSERWVGRAPPSSPSTRQRVSDDASAVRSSSKKQRLQPTEGRPHILISEDSLCSLVNIPSPTSSPSTMTNTGESSISLIACLARIASAISLSSQTTCWV